MSQNQSLTAAKVLDRMHKLPSRPSLVLELLESFEDERMDVATLARKISNDQALVARVMRVANSAFFGLSGQISTMSEAISILGFNNLRGLVTAAAIINAAPKNLGRFDQHAFWRHGICAAACAKVLAKRVGVNPEIAFTAGILHDIGKLIIAMEFPDTPTLQATVDGSDEESLATERTLLGFDHAILGGELAARWNFPVSMREAIGLHHSGQEESGRGGLTDVIYIANVFAHALEDGHIRESKLTHLGTEASARLMLGHADLLALAEEAQQLYAGSVLLVGE